VLVPDDEMRAALAAGRDVYARSNPLPASCQDLAASIGSLVERGIITEEAGQQGLSEL
jgi:hypothetical protein